MHTFTHFRGGIRQKNVTEFNDRYSAIEDLGDSGKKLKDDVVLHDVSIYKHKCGKAFVLKILMVVAKILSSFCNNI